MWTYQIHVPSRCVDERFCKSCRKTENVLRHRWSKWIVEFWGSETRQTDGTITTHKIAVQTRVCVDCSLRESNEYHARKV